MQESLWFSLGYAASQLGDNNLEIKAFKRSVTLEPDVSLVHQQPLVYLKYLVHDVHVLTT